MCEKYQDGYLFIDSCLNEDEEKSDKYLFKKQVAYLSASVFY